jgi:predicted metal-dependent peptidase
MSETTTETTTTGDEAINSSETSKKQKKHISRATDVNISHFEQICVKMLYEAPFFAEISRHIHKVPTRDIPTACVAFDMRNYSLVMYWNPEFVAAQTNEQLVGLIKHEILHIVFQHITYRFRKPPVIWNIATDCAINSIIATDHKDDSKAHLPDCVILPGKEILIDVTKEPYKSMSEEDLVEQRAFSEIIKNAPPMMASEWYFAYLQQEMQDKCPNMIAGHNVAALLDDHSMWEEIAEGQREMIQGKLRSIIEKAVKEADSRSNGWGSMSQMISGLIRRSVSNIINWRSVLRNFTGSLVRGKRKTSIKRINKRFPMVHPGATRGYTAKLLVCVDQSGSVDDHMLETFFGELRSCNKRVEFDYLPFDCEAYDKEIVTWRRGACPEIKRTRAGGTDFSAPTRVANDPKNRGRWDGVLIVTDGQAPQPVASRLKRAWVLGKGCNLIFTSNEIQIKLDDDKKFGDGGLVR